MNKIESIVLNILLHAAQLCFDLCARKRFHQYGANETVHTSQLSTGPWAIIRFRLLGHPPVYLFESTVARGDRKSYVGPDRNRKSDRF